MKKYIYYSTIIVLLASSNGCINSPKPIEKNVAQPLMQEVNPKATIVKESNSSIGKKENLLNFKNKIESYETCDNIRGGNKIHLINSDKKNRYRVTLIKTVTTARGRSSTNELYTIEAGGKYYLGCTKFTSIAGGYTETRSYSVMGEVKL